MCTQAHTINVENIRPHGQIGLYTEKGDDTVSQTDHQDVNTDFYSECFTHRYIWCACVLYSMIETQRYMNL